MARTKLAKWKPIHIVQVYRMVKAGMQDIDICRSLHVSQKSYIQWQREKPELAEAISIARKEMSDGETFPDWIYSRLSPELREIWQQICHWHRKRNGVSQIEMILSDHGKIVRQQLFLYALCVSAFSASVACQRVNITKRTLDEWISSDPNFAELVEELQWHKGNFFEESLVRLVKEGNPAAILFANKTFNSARGYGARMSVDVNHSGSVLHGVVDLSELIPFLTEPCKLELLEAIRKREVRGKEVLTVTDHISAHIAAGATVID